MGMSGLLVLAIAPAIFILCYFYLRDRYEPEPLGWVVKVFLVGAIMVIPAALIETPFPSGLLTAVFVAPIVEEALKFAAVYFTVYRDEEFDEPMDGIVYASAAALGFAMLENVMYVIEGGVAVGIVRAVVSVPAHALFSSIWGYSLGIARFRHEKDRPFLIAIGLAGAIAFHGIFNFMASDSELLGLIVILVLLVPGGWWLAHRHIGHAHAHPASAQFLTGKRAPPKASPGIPEAGIPRERGSPPSGYCTKCGNPLSPDAKFCGMCGEPVERV